MCPALSLRVVSKDPLLYFTPNHLGRETIRLDGNQDLFLGGFILWLVEKDCHLAGSRQMPVPLISVPCP